MRNKLILFLMLALFGSTSFLRADEVVIGDGTATTYYAPFNSLWGYSFVEQVYLADEIGTAGTINSISFNMSEAADFTSEFDIFMKNVSRDAFASDTDFEPVVAGDIVYSGSVTFQPGWTTITLDTPFAYDGTSNLMVGVHEKTSGYSTRYFYYTAVTGGLISGHSDSVDPNPYDMGSYTGTTYMKDYRSNIILDITPGGSGGGGVAGEITVHDGTVTNGNVPVYGFYADAYLKCEMVYPAAELADMANGTINSIKFYASTPASEAWTSTWQVFVSEVADATISDFYGPGTVVYEGPLDGTMEEMEIVFNAPYAYNGGNLLIGVYNITTGNYKSVTWAGETVDGASVSGYDYNSLSGISAIQRNFLPKTTFYYEKSETPVPTDILAITPNPVALGYRPTNGWMEPMAVRIYNGLENAVTMTGNMSNTAGVNAFVMSEEINDVVLESEEALDFEIDINPAAAAGAYSEQFTLFYAENSKDITIVPVTANFYEAGPADIVETAVEIDPASFDEYPTDLHPNYIGANGMMANDAVYTFTLAKDALFNVTADAGSFIGIYNKVQNFHPTYAVEPVAYAMEEMQDQTLLAGEYYMIVAGNAITEVSGYADELPAPTQLYADAPEDGAVDVAVPMSLTWHGGENAAEYQVLFGTSPTNMDIALDWTVIDENYGSFAISSLDNNTQYFWQIKARNSNGTVQTQRRGFTTKLNSPNTVTASETEIFTDGSTLIKWKLAGTGGFSGELTVADGTSTNSYVPVYGLWMDYYTRGEMIYPAEMLEEMNGGEISSMKFYISSPATGPWTGNVYQVYLAEVDATTLTSYYTEANATVVYTGSLDGQGTEMEIVFDDPYTYGGGNLLVGIAETVKGTWKSCSFYGVDATGASASGYNSSSLSGVTFNQRDFLPKVTFTCGARNSYMVESARTHQGFNVYYGDVKANTELITERQYLLSNLPYNLTGHNVTVTAVYDEGESAKSDPVVVKVSGYGTFTGTVTELISGAPIPGVNVKFFGKDEFQNTVAFEGTTNASGVYTINNVKAGNYTGTATLEGMEPANSDPVTLAYDATETVPFVMHEVYVPVLSVVAEEMDPEMSRVKWSLNVDIPVPGGNTPGGGSASSFSEGFEGGMPADWNVIDGNNDGWTWCMTSAIPSTWTYYASLSLDWYRTGTNAICSGSYINGVGALNPDEYLVMGQQNLVNGSTLSFWAAATDASYPADHFGVCVSDNGTSDWTVVDEWTLTAKGGANNGGRESRDGKGAKLGTWYNYSVDLSAYAGQKYIAIRHFNCTDQYIMVVDDIELSAAKSTRDVQRYALYRKAILKENELVPADSVMISDAITDTLYADFDWANMEPGLYQYGVSAIYPSPAKGGNRDEVIIGEGTGTSSYVPTYNLYNYSCTNQIYTAEEIGGAGTINSIAFMPATVNATSRNLNVYMVNTEKTSFASGSDWIPVTADDLVYSGTVAWTANTWSTITLANPFQFDGTNLCVVVNDLTGSWTSSNSYYVSNATAQAIRIYQDSAPYNPAAPGSGAVLDVKNNIKLDITYGGAGGNDDPVTPITWSNVLPKDIETTVVVNAQVPDATAEGVTVRFDNTFENTTFTITLDETGTDTIVDFRKGEYEVTFNLEGYTSNVNGMAISIWEDTEITAVFEEIFKPVTTVTASRSGYVTWDAIVPVDRVAESYIVRLDGAEYAQTTDNFIQLDQDDLVVGQTYTVGVAVLYTSGISPTVNAQFTYADCSTASYQVEDLEAANEPGDTHVTLAWNGETPTPPTPPTPPTGGWTEGFESGMPAGWNVIDANNDGWTWCLTSAIPTTWTYYASVTLDWYRTGTNAICSGSYINGVGALTPDEYLVMGQQSIVNGSTLTFWAAAADASYPADHFGVFVSDNGTSGWTSVQEWTLTGKGSVNGGRESRDGKGAKLGSWHQFTADLSAFAGSTKYIAIRHFNCNDQYIMVVDDIEFTGAKRGGNLAAAGVGFGVANNALTDDGNWYYYDNGSNEDAIGTGGGNFWWGIMLPAGSYEGNRLTKVAAYDYMAMTGTASIYQGGTSAPAGTALGTVNVTMTGSNDFREYEFAEAVELDPEQNVWVVFYNGSGATYPAAVCTNTGDANGRWVSLDGSTWEDLAGYSLNYTFMVRAYIESGSGPAPTALVPNKYNIFVDDVLVGATASNTFTYDAGDFEEHEYVVVWVDADGLVSCIDEDVNDILYAAAPLGVAENMINTTIYPNPTDGDIRINANNMVRISIVNTLGQVVYDKAVAGDEAIINMAQFGNGVYMVNIATENGTSVKRVIVSK